MATITRKPAALEPEPSDPNDSMLVSVEQLLALASAAASTRKLATAKVTYTPATWAPAVMAAAAALPIPIKLPTQYPVKGPGAQLNPAAWVAAPKDLTGLDHPACPARRNDPLLAAIRAALLNDWHGHALHRGTSAADGGVLPLSVLFMVLATQPSQQKARRWAQILHGSGQTNVLAQVANVAARFVVCRPEGITLVRDFYAQ